MIYQSSQFHYGFVHMGSVARCPRAYMSSKDFEVFLDLEETVVLGFNIMVHAQQGFADTTTARGLTWIRTSREAEVFNKLCGRVRYLSASSSRI